MITIEIVGAAIERQKDSLRIRNAIEERSTAHFTVVDRLGTAAYSKGQLVEIYKDSALEFAGVVSTVNKYRIPSSPIFYHEIICADWHYLADKRLAAESYTNTRAGTIIADLRDKYLAAEGVTVGIIQIGATIEEMVINYAQVSQANLALAERSGYIWYIDKNKKLYFGDRVLTPARRTEWIMGRPVVLSTDIDWVMGGPWVQLSPFEISTMATAPFIVDARNIRRFSPNARIQAHQYRNRQYVRAGRDITSLQTENFTGDAATVAFPVGYPIVSEPTVTVAGVPQTIGLKGIDAAKQCYWSKSDPIVTFAAPPAGAVAIVMSYYGEYDILVVADAIAAIAARQAVEGGTGLVEALDDEPSLTSKTAAFEAAQAKLAKFGIIGQVFHFETFQSGLESGQLLTVNYSEYGYNNTEMLIESIEMTEYAPDTPLYAVTAIEGPEKGDWSAFFGRLAHMKDEILDRLVIGKDQVLILLAAFEGEWEWSETVTETVYACPTPGLLVYPSLTMYPC